MAGAQAGAWAWSRPLPVLGVGHPAQGNDRGEPSSGAETVAAPSPPVPHSLCHHRDFLPGLLHRPLQLPGAAGPEAALLPVQVSPGRPLAVAPSPHPSASVSCVLAPEVPALLPWCRAPLHSPGPQPSGTARACSRRSLSAGWRPRPQSGGQCGSGRWFSGLSPHVPYLVGASGDAGAEVGAGDACGSQAGAAGRGHVVRCADGPGPEGSVLPGWPGSYSVEDRSGVWAVGGTLPLE